MSLYIQVKSFIYRHPFYQLISNQMIFDFIVLSRQRAAIITVVSIYACAKLFAYLLKSDFKMDIGSIDILNLHFCTSFDN